MSFIVDSTFALMLVLLGGLLLISFGAKFIPAARRQLDPLVQFRMVAAIAWIAIVSTFYQTEIVDRLEVVQNHDDTQQCENRNLNRGSNRNRFENRIELLEDRLDDALARVPVDPSLLPGYGEYNDDAVQATVDALVTVTEADRVKDIDVARNDLMLEQSEYTAYVQDFPLEDCNGDGVIEIVPGTDSTGLTNDLPDTTNDTVVDILVSTTSEESEVP